jgi:hypothetical protein
MQNYGIVITEDGSFAGTSSSSVTQSARVSHIGTAAAPVPQSTRMVRLSPSPTRQSPPPEMSLLAFQESMAWSYFYDNCIGSRCWRFLFRVDDNEPHAQIRTLANSAIVHGYMGAGYGYRPLQEKGATLYTQALQQSRAALSSSLLDPNRVQLATFPLALLSLTFYTVSFSFTVLQTCQTD